MREKNNIKKINTEEKIFCLPQKKKKIILFTFQSQNKIFLHFFQQIINATYIEIKNN